ncbi:MAG: 6-phosphofructokinase [Caldiserica bacterium]|nr:6-phosphofructokinase [Caldisericota bacterium]MDH7562100.1 6-phosphofructokinase [Caldisericota bacterium]
MSKRIGLLTSGGDAPGMNAAIRAVVRQGIKEGAEIVGIMRGFEGLISGEFIPLDLSSVSGIIQRGGTILLTARCEEFKTPEGVEEAVKKVKKAKMDGLILIGGDGTFRGGMELEKRGIPTIGVPASIDDDLWGTDHTIGFDTAVNTALQALDKIRDTATSHERAFVVEVMGRTAGYLALMSGLAGGAEFIAIPEVPFKMEEVAQAIKRGFERKKRHFIIVLAEGVMGAYQLAQELYERTGHEIKVSILGHIQRGGNPSAYDRYLASRLGAAAVQAIISGRRGEMVGLKNEEIVLTPYSQAVSRRKEIDLKAYELSKILGL